MSLDDLNKTMTREPMSTPRRIAARAASAYAVVGVAWIVLSDQILAVIWPQDWLTLSWIKGVAFIFCTAAGLFILIKRDTMRMLHAEAQQRDALHLCGVVIEHCPSAIVLFDSRRVRLINPAFEALLGFDSDAQARQASLSDHVHPDDLAAYKATLQAIAQDPTAAPLPAVERRLITRDGLTRSVDLSLAPVSVGHERLTLAVIQDTTERRAQAERLIEAERLAAIGRLASGTAHDLNNILAAISSCNSLLRRSASSAPPQDPEACRCLDDIDDIARRGHAIAAELVAFSPTASSTPSTPSTLPPAIPLNDAIRDAQRFLMRLLPNSIQLSVSLCDSPCAAYLSSSHIDQILLNLITNARDAMPHGGTIRVSTALSTATPPRITLTISDEGAGIPPEVQAKLFSPFFSTKQPGRGTGLGLVTVRRLVEQAGGTIRIDSAPAQGTRAILSLPAAPLPPAPHRRLPTPPAIEGALLRVLLVDDEPMVRRPLSRLLKSLGCAVVEAADGTQALSFAQAEPFDAILSDLSMPDMDGLALQAALQAAHIHTPLILMSGYGQPTAAPDDPPPTYHWLQKPFTPDTLQRTLRRATLPAGA